VKSKSKTKGRVFKLVPKTVRSIVRRKRVAKVVPAKVVLPRRRRAQAARAVPMAKTTVTLTQPPVMRPGGQGDMIVVRRRELIGTVAPTDNNFAFSSIIINPGLATYFPWLAGIAQNFRSYRIRRLVAEFVPTCPVTQAGTVGIAFDSNPMDADPTTLVAACNLPSINGSAYGNLVLPWRARDEGLPHGRRFIRTGALAAGTDYALYDEGFFGYFTSGANGATGQCYLDYEIELWTPVPPPA